MAVVYLGQNDLSKKINNIYIGIDNQSKQVIKGYVGVDGYSKLFYNFNFKIFPTLLSSELLAELPIGIGFYLPEAQLGVYRFVDENKEGLITSDSAKHFYTNSGKIYLGKNCSKLFNNYFFTTFGSPKIYNYKEQSIEEKFNLEKYFLFNKVENLSFFFNDCTATTNLYNVTGNLANCNFINVQDMSYAFYGCTGLTESAQSGPNVTNMAYAYINCSGLNGSPACGPEVTNLRYTYYQCRALTGEAAITDKVIDAQYAYCRAGTYTGLYINNLYVANYQAINLSNCFREAGSVYGDIYIKNIESNIVDMFNGRSWTTPKYVNIHYPLSLDLSKFKCPNVITSGETHTLFDQQYIDIGVRGNSSAFYKVKIYNDYIV